MTDNQNITNNNLSIYCQNVRGVSNKLAEFQKLLGSSPCPPIICLSETHRKKDLDLSLLRAFQCFYSHSITSNHTNGLAIFVRQDISAHLSAFTNSNTLYSLTVTIRHPTLQKPLIISQIYIPPVTEIGHLDGYNTCIAIFNNIQSYANKEHADWLMLGDFNARHPSFGDSKSNPAGIKLEAFLNTKPEITNLNIIHCPGEPTRLESGSVIDLAFTNITHKDNLITKIISPTLMSDHEAIQITIPQTKIPIILKAERKIWDTSNFNIHKYQLALQQLSSQWLQRNNTPSILNDMPLDPQQQIDNMWATLRDNIISAASTTSSKKTLTKSYRTWINQRAEPHNNALDVELCNMQRARRKYLLRELDREEYFTQLNAFRQSILAQKRTVERKSLSKVDDDRQVVFDWKPMKQFLNNTASTFAIPPVETAPGVYAENLQGSVDALARHFAATSTIEEPPPERRTKHEAEIYELINQFVRPKSSKKRSNIDAGAQHEWDPKHMILFSEVKQALEELEVKKAIGPDDVHPLFLKEGDDALFSCITLLFNFSLRWSVLPLQWKQALVVPIIKAGQNASLPTSYRPISLTCIICKCIERILLLRLNSHRHKYSSNIPQRSRQAGFTVGTGTEYQLLRVRSAQLEAIKQNVHRPFVFLDISKAFDRVWHAGLIASLIRNGFARYLIFWITAFLVDRLIRVVYAGLESQWYPINAGVPQGAVLSPFLFLVFIDDVTFLNDCALALFADDIAAWYENSLDTKKAVTALNTLLNDLLKWAKRNKVTFSPTKSVVLNVGPTFKSVDIKLGSSTLECVKEFKYLGVVFSYNGDWDAHIKHVTQKCYSSLQRISLTSTYFNRLSSLSYLINAYLVPIISYGWPCWKPTPTQFTVLRNVFLSFIRTFCKLSRTTYIEGMLDALGLPDLISLHDLSLLRAKTRLCNLPFGHVAATLKIDKAHLHHLAFPRQLKSVIRKIYKALHFPFFITDKEALQHMLSAAYRPTPLHLKLDPMSISILRIRIRLRQTDFKCDLRQRRQLMSTSATCTNCSLNEDESAEHVLARCTLLSTHRASMIDSILSLRDRHRLRIPPVFSTIPNRQHISCPNTASTLLLLCSGLTDTISSPDRLSIMHPNNHHHLFNTTVPFLQALLDLRPP